MFNEIPKRIIKRFFLVPMAYYGKTDCVEVFSDDHVETTARHDKDDCGDICDGEREREREREREGRGETCMRGGTSSWISSFEKSNFREKQLLGQATHT